MDRIPSNHRLAERRLIEFVTSGFWRIDEEGRIWNGPCRAEKRVQSGYLMVRRMVNGKRIVGLAHRLVWQFFFGDIPTGMVVNHENGIKDDNRPKNLRVVSMSENSRHAHTNGLVDQYGQKNPAAKLSDSQVGAIRTAYSSGDFTMQQLAHRFGVRVQHVSRLVKGERRPKQGGKVMHGDLRHSVCERDPSTGRFIGDRADGREWNEFPEVKSVDR